MEKTWSINESFIRIVGEDQKLHRKFSMNVVKNEIVENEIVENELVEIEIVEKEIICAEH